MLTQILLVSVGHALRARASSWNWAEGTKSVRALCLQTGFLGICLPCSSSQHKYKWSVWRKCLSMQRNSYAIYTSGEPQKILMTQRSKCITWDSRSVHQSLVRFHACVSLVPFLFFCLAFDLLFLPHLFIYDFSSRWEACSGNRRNSKYQEKERYFF